MQKNGVRELEAIDKTAQLGLPYMGGLSFQKVSKEIPKNFDMKLTDDELKQIRLKLDSAGIRLLTYYFHNIPGDKAGCREVFEFGRDPARHVGAVGDGLDRDLLRRHGFRQDDPAQETGAGARSASRRCSSEGQVAEG